MFFFWCETGRLPRFSWLPAMGGSPVSYLAKHKVAVFLAKGGDAGALLGNELGHAVLKGGRICGGRRGSGGRHGGGGGRPGRGRAQGGG